MKNCNSSAFSQVAMNRSLTLASLYSDSSAIESDRDDRQSSQSSQTPVVVDENDSEEPLCLSLIPSSRILRDGSVTVHRKHSKITAGPGTSRKKKQSVSILKELKKSNETLAQKLKKREKKM